jgi:acyl-CoA thioesterase-2
VTQIEKAWPKYPGYRIDLVPMPGRVRVTHGDLLLAESDGCLRVEEANHVDRIYVPEGDVRWELFEATDTATTCPFKGEASYFTLTASDPPLRDLVWTYRAPFEEVAGLAGHVCFFEDRVLVELEDPWPGVEPGAGQRLRLPVWGDQADLLRIMDPEPAGGGRYVAPVLRFLHPDMRDLRGQFRNVVEGGQLLGTAIAAAWKEVPDQRVTMATVNFVRAATFDEPIDVDIDVLRRGRTFSTSEVRLGQGGTLCAAGILLHDAGADDVMRHGAPMPEVPGPDGSVPLDFGVTGRETRVVDAGYDDSTDRLGPPEIHTWCRFRDAPPEPRLHAALAAQSVTHWTIAASMRPHEGMGEAAAHVTLTTGPMTASVWLLEDIDVTGWLLYANPSPWAGRGLSQGEGKVFTQDGRLVATYAVQAMVRSMERPPDALGGPNRAM